MRFKGRRWISFESENLFRMIGVLLPAAVAPDTERDMELWRWGDGIGLAQKNNVAGRTVLKNMNAFYVKRNFVLSLCLSLLQAL